MITRHKSKILLISLRDPFLDSDRVMPPLGIMSLHSYMLSLGFSSAIENDFDINDMEKYIHKYNNLRLHSALNYDMPMNVYREYFEAAA